MLYIVKLYIQKTLTEETYIVEPAAVTDLIQSLLERNPDTVTIAPTDIKFVAKE